MSRRKPPSTTHRLVLGPDFADSSRFHSAPFQRQPVIPNGGPLHVPATAAATWPSVRHPRGPLIFSIVCAPHLDLRSPAMPTFAEYFEKWPKQATAQRLTKSLVAALAASGALPENVNYAIKSRFLLSFLESVPEVAAKMKEPGTKEQKFEDVVKSAEQAAVLVLVY